MANDNLTHDPPRVQLRRYPNRRYYDSARREHLTLDGIFRLICDGHQVQVNDSRTGEDISVRVLTQLILEQAPGKLAALPAELLHQIIRSNESLLREFVDKYFYRALTAFIASQGEFDRYLRQALGLQSAVQNPRAAWTSQGFPFLAPNWASLMMGPFARAFLAGPSQPVELDPSAASPPQPGAAEADVRKAVDELQQQVDALRKRLNSDPQAIE